MTLGRSAFAVGGVDDAELDGGGTAVGAGEYWSVNSEPLMKPTYIKIMPAAITQNINSFLGTKPRCSDFSTKILDAEPRKM